MEDTIDITSETLTGGETNVAPSVVKETVGTAPAPAADQLSLEEINRQLGKNYKDKDAFLKSIQDTFSYVGAKKETIVKDIDTSQFISREQYEKDMFYSQNPELNKKEVRTVLDAMAKANGVSVKEVAESEDFKSLFGKVKGYEESQSIKTVLETNPRIAAQQDSFQRAGELIKAGNRDQAESLIARAVLGQ